MGGSVEVLSEVGVGTEFKIKLKAICKEKKKEKHKENEYIWHRKKYGTVTIHLEKVRHESSENNNGEGAQLISN